MPDYRKLRLSNYFSPEFRHLNLLHFWPAVGLVFLILERFIPGVSYHPVWCPLDDLIPFNELFLIPYLGWFVLYLWIHVYLLLKDIPAFRRFMYFLYLTYIPTLIFYAVYPTCQNLRPESFARENILTWIMGLFYQMDTSTNVCPSLHVVGSMAIAFAVWDTPGLKKPLIRWGVTALCVLISISTVFVKQHSVVDVIAGAALSAVVYIIVYVIPWKKGRRIGENK